MLSKPPLLQAGQVLLPQLLLTGQVLKLSLSCSPSAELLPIYQCLEWTQYSKCSVMTDEDNHFPGSTGYALVNTIQVTFGLLCCQCTLLSHAQPIVPQTPRSFSAGLCLRQPVPSLHCVSRFFLHRYRALHSSLINFVRYLSVCLGLPGGQLCPQCISWSPPIRCDLQT